MSGVRDDLLSSKSRDALKQTACTNVAASFPGRLGAENALFMICEIAPMISRASGDLVTSGTRLTKVIRRMERKNRVIMAYVRVAKNFAPDSLPLSCVSVSKPTSVFSGAAVLSPAC